MDYIVIVSSFLIGVFIGGFFMTRRAEVVIKGLLKKLEKKKISNRLRRISRHIYVPTVGWHA